MQGGTSKAGFKNNDRLSKKRKKGKKIKDPNKPKRPPSPFFAFMEGFRKQFKEQNPGVKGPAAMAKAGGDKWRSMSNDDKAEFVTMAEQRKKDYEKKMKAYEIMQARGNEEVESDKSKSEVNEEDKEGKGVNFNWNMEKKKRGRFYKRKKKIFDLGAENSEEIVKKRIDRGQEICIVSTSSDDEEIEKVESFDGTRKRIIRANSNGKKGSSSDSECGDSGEKDEGFVQENDRVDGNLDEEDEVRKIRALFKKMIVDVEGEDIENMSGSGDQDIRDETEIIERSDKQKKANYEEIELRSQREEDVIIKNVYNTELNESFPEDDRFPNRCKESSTNKDNVEVIPNTMSMGQPIYTPSTSHDSPNISHQSPLSIPTETVGFFKQLADMLQGNKSEWVLPPQIQLDEQTICDYEQLLKTGLSGDLRDLYKDSTYQEFNEALTGLLACRRIPSKLHQGFLSLRRDLPSLASRAFDLDKEITQGMLQRVNRSTTKELESCLHKYRKCEEHVLKLEQEKECNVSKIGMLKARNQVIDSEIGTYTAEADALQKTSAAQSLKIANVDVAGALNESTLQRSLDDLANMENEWRKRVDTLDF